MAQELPPPQLCRQAVTPDASIRCLSTNFLASLLGWLSLGTGEQRRSASYLKVRDRRDCLINQPKLPKRFLILGIETPA
jgi:hypothetical protein